MNILASLQKGNDTSFLALKMNLKCLFLSGDQMRFTNDGEKIWVITLLFHNVLTSQLKVNRTDYRSLAFVGDNKSERRYLVEVFASFPRSFVAAKHQCFGFLSSLLNSKRFDRRRNLPLDFARCLNESS